MTRAYCAGLNVVGILQETPPWASPVKDASGWKYNASDSTDWQRFVTASVDRYPWVRYWTIWNEPNSKASYLQTPEDYARLVAWAAPGIRDNIDAQGRRYLIAGEVGQDSNAATWLNRLLTLEGDKVDVVAIHSYGDVANDFVRNLRASTGVTPWTWDIWLTETNVTGCYDSDDGFRSSWTGCVNVNGVRTGPVSSWIYIDDGAQATFLTSNFQNLASGTVDPFWKKTFYYDSHSEPNQSTGPDSRPNDYGVIGGSRNNALYVKQAYYALSRAAGLTPYVSVSGPTSADGGTSIVFTASISGGHPDQYYYEWRMKCTPRGTPTGECNGAEVILDEGWNLSSITVDVPSVDGTALVTALIRDTELDSPVTPAYADRASKKVGISRY